MEYSSSGPVKVITIIHPVIIHYTELAIIIINPSAHIIHNYMLYRNIPSLFTSMEDKMQSTI